MLWTQENTNSLTVFSTTQNADQFHGARACTKTCELEVILLHGSMQVPITLDRRHLTGHQFALFLSDRSDWWNPSHGT